MSKNWNRTGYTIELLSLIEQIKAERFWTFSYHHQKYSPKMNAAGNYNFPSLKSQIYRVPVSKLLYEFCHITAKIFKIIHNRSHSIVWKIIGFFTLRLQIQIKINNSFNFQFNKFKKSVIVAINYLCQGGYVGRHLSVCLSVCQQLYI